MNRLKIQAKCFSKWLWLMNPKKAQLGKGNWGIRLSGCRAVGARSLRFADTSAADVAAPSFHSIHHNRHPWLNHPLFAESTVDNLTTSDPQTQNHQPNTAARLKEFCHPVPPRCRRKYATTTATVFGFLLGTISTSVSSTTFSTGPLRFSSLNCSMMLTLDSVLFRQVTPLWIPGPEKCKLKRGHGAL